MRRNIVVKISPFWYNTSLCRKAWCYNRVSRETEIKVPEVILYIDHKNDILLGHEILILQYIPGRVLNISDMRSTEFHKK
ncbi:MAG: hypothetical protein DRP84_10750 [Spirochaetes bacterium]|nr:MAG: hypothetical protein DRP84_10750 [Spirochaetota bacterium]